MGDGRKAQYFQRLVVEDIAFRERRIGPAAVAGVQNAAVAVVGVFAEADVGDNEKLWQPVFEGASGLLDDAVRIEVFKSHRVFRGGEAKKDHGRNAQSGCFGRFRDRIINRKLVDTRHGWNGAADVSTVSDKEGVNKIGWVYFRFPHH